MEVMEMSRQIMVRMEAFKGSKPVLHNPEAMLIRGKSAVKIKKENMASRLEELFEELEIKKVEINSEKARNLTDKVDESLRRVTEVYDESNGLAGIEKLKNTFEMTGFDAEYIIGQIEDTAVYVVIWADKSGFGPMFVETMVIRIEE